MQHSLCRVKDKIITILSNKRNLIILVALVTIGVSIQAFIVDKPDYNDGKKVYSEYNNYTIYHRSFHNLVDNKNLYIHYPEYHWDLYKYTPTFSAFFGLFAIFPDWLGISLWNLLNAFVLLFAIYYMPQLNKLEKGLIILIILVDLITSMQNEQSNALIAGLLILSFGLLENRKYLIATLLLVFSVYIKLFGLVGFALFLLYPKKWKLALYTSLWTIVLFLIPLLFIDYSQYVELYKSYWKMLTFDLSASYGYSIMGWLYAWFCIDINKYIIVLSGILVFLLPLTRIREYKFVIFRYLILTSILIWIVIFNHKAETSTYIIACAGIALWFIRSEKTAINIVLFAGAFILSSLSPTDLIPQYVREELIIPYALNVFPCILIWMKIVYEVVVFKDDRNTETITN